MNNHCKLKHTIETLNSVSSSVYCLTLLKLITFLFRHADRDALNLKRVIASTGFLEVVKNCECHKVS